MQTINHKFAYKHFGDYERFEEFCNLARGHNWLLHSWQDVGGRDGIDIRALFIQDSRNYTTSFPGVLPPEKQS